MLEPTALKRGAILLEDIGTLMVPIGLKARARSSMPRP